LFSVPDARQDFFNLTSLIQEKQTNKQTNIPTSKNVMCIQFIPDTERGCKPSMTMLSTLVNVSLEDPLMLQC